MEDFVFAITQDPPQPSSWSHHHQFENNSTNKVTNNDTRPTSALSLPSSLPPRRRTPLLKSDARAPSSGRGRSRSGVHWPSRIINTDDVVPLLTPTHPPATRRPPWGKEVGNINPKLLLRQRRGFVIGWKKEMDDYCGSCEWVNLLQYRASAIEKQ